MKLRPRSTAGIYRGNPDPKLIPNGYPCGTNEDIHDLMRWRWQELYPLYIILEQTGCYFGRKAMKKAKAAISGYWPTGGGLRDEQIPGLSLCPPPYQGEAEGAINRIPMLPH